MRLESNHCILTAVVPLSENNLLIPKITSSSYEDKPLPGGRFYQVGSAHLAPVLESLSDYDQVL